MSNNLIRTNTANKYHDIFTYESKIDGGDNAVFENCIILRDFGTLKQGDCVKSLSIEIKLYIWDDDESIAGEEQEYVK